MCNGDDGVMVIMLVTTHSVDGLPWKSHGIKSTQRSVLPKSLPKFELHVPVGPTARTKSAKTPLGVLELFLTVIILEGIVLHSKTIAQRKGRYVSICKQRRYKLRRHEHRNGIVVTSATV